MEKTPKDNSVLIPRDLSERRPPALSAIMDPKEQEEEKQETHKFDILPPGATERKARLDYKRSAHKAGHECPTCGAGVCPTCGKAADQQPQKKHKDYQQAYLARQKEMELARRNNEQEIRRKGRTEEEKKLLAQRQEMDIRNRARYLQDQILIWETRRNEGSCEEDVISANISTLEQELKTIDQRYWY